MSEEVLLLQGCLGDLEVFPVTALSLPFVNLIGEDKPFLDRCPWFTVLLLYDQNRFLQQCQQLNILRAAFLGPAQLL